MPCGKMPTHRAASAVSAERIKAAFSQKFKSLTPVPVRENDPNARSIGGVGWGELNALNMF